MKILIIGQGIAGTLLAWNLRKKGARPTLVDGNLPGGSSIAAAGIINPVTGKRFAKSWRFDEFYPVAQASYRALEQELGIQIWEDRPTLRLLGTVEEANDWSLRCAQEDYQTILSDDATADDWAPTLKPGFRYGLIRHSARANMPLMVQTYREAAIREGFFESAQVEYAETETLLKAYDRIVFCEGWRGAQNPYFPEAKFRVSKGEALKLRFIGDFPPPTRMLKKNVLVAPLGEGIFWAGSTYRWTFEDTLPNAEGRDYLMGFLREMFAVPFEIVDQVSGVRPTMIDRRPMVQQSALNPKVFTINGLGTKGALLAPFFARELSEKIMSGG